MNSFIRNLKKFSAKKATNIVNRELRRYEENPTDNFQFDLFGEEVSIEDMPAYVALIGYSMTSDEIGYQELEVAYRYISRRSYEFFDSEDEDFCDYIGDLDMPESDLNVRQLRQLGRDFAKAFGKVDDIAEGTSWLF